MDNKSTVIFFLNKRYVERTVGNNKVGKSKVEKFGPKFGSTNDVEK